MNPELRRGVGYGFVCYLLWGCFPLYFRLLGDSGALEVLLWRIVFTGLVCLVLVAALRSWREMRTVLGNRRQVVVLGAAAFLIAINWGVYIYAVNSDQVVEAALGYFLNPLVTVALGVLVLRERLRPGQWAAVLIGVSAGIVLTVTYGRVPVIALSLALSFGTYGLVKKQVGSNGGVSALAGLSTENLVLAPFAVAGLIVLAVQGHSTIGHNPPWQALLLASTGVFTITPLLLFAAAAKRVPLSTMGLMQYLTPVLQFLCGVVVLGEHMPGSRWAGFGLVWLALVVLTGDSLLAARRQRALRLAAAEVATVSASPGAR
ncbi:EamA family transporter RarD [Kineosporia sp. J2-2]|uniref:EamA family transporter RarD n=1 Tax=Kineosporia corallincola TaxID=2835133 RepID=A0ABS5T9N5_9ACTN|nr:EamA family transporter RarD [Kineosporia corallincola]MBT0767785.1 EamA family transporter RarD [Kineosporia corallincola]